MTKSSIRVPRGLTALTARLKTMDTAAERDFGSGRGATTESAMREAHIPISGKWTQDLGSPF